MLPRAAKRIETALLLSRQGLRRPARLFTTPTKRADAPSLEAHQTLADDAYMPPPPQNTPASSQSLDMQKWLIRPPEIVQTMMQPPLPEDRSSPENDAHYPDSVSLDTLAVIDACLYNAHDVPRAQHLLRRFEKSKPGDPKLTAKLYNTFLEAYLTMATSNEDAKEIWIDEAWTLYQEMEHGKKPNAEPTEGTYAIMLILWYRFSSDPRSSSYVSRTLGYSAPILLRQVVERRLSIPLVVADRAFSSSEEANKVIKLLSKHAAAEKLSNIVAELGQVEALGCTYEDPRKGVPSVKPVLKKKISGEQPDENIDLGPGVTPVIQEDEYEIPFNLDNLRKHLNNIAHTRKVLSDDLSARQHMLELSVYEVATTRLEHEANIFNELGLGHAKLLRADLQAWMWQWYTALSTHLEKEIGLIVYHEKHRTPGVRSKTVNNIPLAPFLTLVKADRLALITILEVMRLQGSGGIATGMKTTRALLTVGRAVEAEYKAKLCKKNNIPLPAPRSSGETPNFFTTAGLEDLRARRIAARKLQDDTEEWTAPWTQTVRVKVGSILVEALMETATVVRSKNDPMTGETISEAQPAFSHSYEYIRGQKLGVISLNPAVADRLARDDVGLTIHPRHLPMLTKPSPWVSYDRGGYLYNITSAMRFKDSAEQKAILREATNNGKCEYVYAGLDVLGGTPWVINRDVFDVVLQVWNSGQRLGKLPPAVYDKPAPEKPENYDTDLKARSAYLARQKGYTQSKANNHSARCNVNYKIEIARAFLGDVFYQPHNLDFRGRAYPIPPHLNHIGDDLSRGLLKFAEKKPLGVRGMRWLKIHLSNLYGYDKASFDERVIFTETHLKEIFASAENPLADDDDCRWWRKADDPWQCLATCMELRHALQSPDPLAYESGHPVHQDGTCNGLQHYAALGGDAVGAAQVNLSATDRPSDVYTYVGNMVEERLAKDSAAGNRFAIMLTGKISRKVVKQTVMTTVYGVTFIGARDQIEKQLKDRGDIPEEECWLAASYLAKQTLTAIGDLFSGATHIQVWLNLCARLISKSIPGHRIEEALSEHAKPSRSKKKKGGNRLKVEQMTSVIWETNLGLPIVQPYRKTKRKQVATGLQTVYISDPNAPAEVDSMKQASAFPPNFIHSLDATHMMLTALGCKTDDITFASVHDSYWTHACSIDRMSELIRDTFISLHSSDVLTRLDRSFRERYAGFKVPLAQIQSAGFKKQLYEAGSRIVVSGQTAKLLRSIDKLLVISDTEQTMVEETAQARKLEALVKPAREAAEAQGLDPEEAVARLFETNSEAAQILESLQAGPNVEDIVEETESEDAAAKDGEDSSAVMPFASLLSSETPEEAAENAAWDEVSSKKNKALKKKVTKRESAHQAQIALLGRFVDVTSILPPLPKKGTFQVEQIKGSQYFFS